MIFLSHTSVQIYTVNRIVKVLGRTKRTQTGKKMKKRNPLLPDDNNTSDT